MCIKFTLSVVLILMPLSAFAQEPLLLWEEEHDFRDIGSQYTQKNYTSFTQLSALKDGSFIAIGNSSNDQLFISKVSTEGQLLWKKKIFIPAETDAVRATDIRVSSSDEILVGGYRLERNFPDDNFPILAWFTSDGKRVWVNATGREDQETKKILNWSEDSILVAESSRYNSSNLRKLNIKFKKKNGDLRGNYKTKDGFYLNLPFGKALLSHALSQEIYAAIAADEPAKKYGTATASGKVCVAKAAKINMAGDVLWTKEILPYSRFCSISDVVTDSEGNFIFSVEQRSQPTKNFGVSARIVSFDVNGNLRFDFKPSSHVAWLQPLHGGDFLTGYENIVTRYSPSGSELWSTRLEKKDLYILSATEANSGDILLGGFIDRKQKVGYLGLLSLASKTRTSYTTETAERYFRQYVKDEPSLIGFYDNVLRACKECNPNDFLNNGAASAQVYGTSPDTRKLPFATLLAAKRFDHSTTLKFIDTVVVSPEEIPFFIDNVLNYCTDCDEQVILKRLTKIDGFGSNIRDNFFGSVEYNYVLKSLPYDEVVSSYFSYVVENASDFEIFFTKILAECPQCDKENYAKLAIGKLSKEQLGINLTGIKSEPVFQHAISLLQFDVGVKTMREKYLIKLQAGGRVFEEALEGNCKFSRKATKVEDAGFLDTLFTGADARRNYYDVYNCKLSENDWVAVQRFAKSVNRSDSISALKEKAEWYYYKYTGDDKIVYERSPSTYVPPPSSDSHSNSGASSSGIASSGGSTVAKKGVRSIESNGKIGGYPSSAITCLTGGRYIVYRKNGTWYTGGGGHMGNKYNSWSVQDIAEDKCR